MSMKASDIPDKDILEYLSARQGEWTGLWFGGFDGRDVYEAVPNGTPSKIVLAKMRALYKRGLVGGCTCGCRGDFEITDKGLQLLGHKRTKPYTGY